MRLLDRFSSQLADYEPGKRLDGPGRATCVSFELSSFRDGVEKVAFERRDVPITTVLTPGGIVRIDEKQAGSSIDLRHVYNTVGRRLNTPPPLIGLPKIDQEEVNKRYQGGRPAGYIRLFLISLVTAAVLAWVWRRRRARQLALSIAILIGTTSGCGNRPAPPPKLSATFDQPRFIYDPPDRSANLNLLITNRGNAEIGILRIDGGCSCRPVSQSGLPARLSPGTTLPVGVSIPNEASYAPRPYRFSLDTDQGAITLDAPLLAIPRHRLAPDSLVQSSLREQSDWNFELTHREVFAPGEKRGGLVLAAPPQFSIESVRTDQGTFPGADKIGFVDTVYKLSLINRDVGTFKEVLCLMRKEGDRRTVFLELPVLWKRTTFLFSTPERVILGPKPARIFLNCEDHQVELTKVLSNPDGVKAVVSSVREITAWLDKDAPSIINGMIEVGTTAQNRPPLRIPVVRYAPDVRAVSNAIERKTTPLFDRRK